MNIQTIERQETSLVRESKSAGEWWSVLAIFAFFVIGGLIISPLGEFPLNDDWVYGLSLRQFMSHGELPSFDFYTAICVVHLILGWFACTVSGGFSFVALRFFTISMAFASCVLLYFSMRELQVKRPLALLGTFTFAANPMVMNVSYSFMTDICSQMFASLYLYLLIQGIKRFSWARLSLAAFALALAISVRNTNMVFIAVNLVVGAYMVFARRLSIKAILPLILIPIFAAASMELLAQQSHMVWYIWNKAHMQSIFKNFFRHTDKELYTLGQSLGLTLMYLGLFLAPLMVPFVPRLLDLFKSKPRIAGASFLLSACVITMTLNTLIVHEHKLMPVSQNLFRFPTLGPINIMGINFPMMPDKARVVLTDLSAGLGFILGAVLLAGIGRAALAAFRRFKSQRELSGRPAQVYWARSTTLVCVFALMALSIAFVTLHTRVFCIDRYYLLALPPAIIALCVETQWLNRGSKQTVSWVLLALMACYSVVAQQDYMGWNRARWTALTKLERSGVSSAVIDGGAEYNYWRNPELRKCLVFKPAAAIFTHKGEPPRNQWRWWSIDDDDQYIASFSTIPGYDVIAKERYWSAMSLSFREVLVLKRVGESVPPVVSSAVDYQSRANFQ